MSSLKKHYHNLYSKGFTLIELLVVISIIGLLSSITLGATTSARNRAYNTAQVQNTRNALITLELYFNTYRGYPNPAGTAGYYCIGATTCTGPLGAVTNNLALEIPLENAPSLSKLNLIAHSILLPKSVEATTYSNTGFASYKLDDPLVFQCTVATSPCPAANSWIWYTQKSTTAITWVSKLAGDTSIYTQN